MNEVINNKYPIIATILRKELRLKVYHQYSSV